MAWCRNLVAASAALAISLSALITGVPQAAADPGTNTAATPAPSTLDLRNRDKIIEMFDRVNMLRTAVGVPPLTFNVTVSEVAEDWSDHMAATGFAHNPRAFDDPRVADRWTAAAENIAYDWSGNIESMVFGWEMSPAHYQSIVNPALTTVGVGLAISESCDPAPDSIDCSTMATLNLFTFDAPPAGTYATARDYFDGKPSLDASFPVGVRAAEPVWNDLTNEYTIPAIAGVDYFVDATPTASSLEPGTYTAPRGYMTVDAVARSGTKLIGRTWWGHKFSRVLPIAPTFNDSDGTETDTFSIPSVEGVQYQVSGKVYDSGTYSAKGTVTVTARALPDYVLADRAAAEWTTTYKATPYQATPAAVLFADKAGTDKDTFTVPATIGVEYVVEGKVTAAGTYAGNGTVTVTARALRDYVLTAGATTEWTTTFSKAAAPYQPPAASPFIDVSTGQQFYKEMAWLAEKGISTGWTEPNGTRAYRPLQSINRDAMAAFLYRAAGSPTYSAPAKSPFADVSTGQQFYKEMAWLAEEGISTGWTEPNGTRTYRPLQSISRDAMAAFLYRAGDSPIYSAPAKSPFADVSTGQQFYKEMAWLAANGISTGWTEPNGTRTYRPFQSINRDAMAAFLYRAAGI
ncbi:S-layer homology domain-containing protein [Arthrobacter sp. zg-Y859]|uniref:S-layer homology domain-containing protein n=1 Tax=Arthrobacter jinronghuae TaxID=2964609 RepID=A0ABT1NM18_9MICC|nr:CAP domain-containing protein [Arthrobacter jinronghuae]MCQ1948753.1 S-layer homology domain-containing protein [Arthrobacter jinronghuae]UWX78434.1 S-layer homology domain-containing protein [Arthrobacter jinronghuae]